MTEVCDGKDNNLDGKVDEGFPDTDNDSIADCMDTDDDNDGVSDVSEVAAGSNPLDPKSTPEICDGKDNDLDGKVDEVVPDTNNNGIADCVDVPAPPPVLPPTPPTPVPLHHPLFHHPLPIRTEMVCPIQMTPVLF